MTWQQSPFLVVLLLGTIVSAGWGVYGIFYLGRHEWSRHVVAFVVLALAVAEWTGLYFVQVASPTIESKLFAYKLLHLGGVAVPPAYFVFAATYADRDDWISPASIAALAAIPIALLVTLPTNPGSLALTDVSVSTAGSLRTLETGNGPLYLLHLAYSYVLLVGGSYLVVRTALRQSNLFQVQSALLVAGAATPLVLNVLEVAGVTVPASNGLNLTPVSLSFSAFAFGIAVFRYRLLDLTPVARDTVLRDMAEGVVVLNHDERVVDVNPATRRILDLDSHVVERDAMRVIPRYEAFETHPDEPVSLTIDQDEDRRVVEMQRSPLDPDGREYGWIVLVRDVTDRERYIEAIERKNERLDEFAGIVAHDLRNPLAVVSASAKLARETGDPEHFARIDETIDGMAALLADVLELARRGETIDDLQTVSLDVIAERAWDNVDTPDARLVAAADATVRADGDRLTQLFENLFRNAVEHGSAITVRVGRLDGVDGFYVEDDGPGIPEADRDAVFDQGYSTNDRGTGLGLPIVESIAVGHGWTIEATEATDGGARFEIVGVELE